MLAEKSLPWEGRVWTELLRLAWPIAVSTLSYSLMTLVDTLFVGHLGTPSLAGVSLGSIAAFALLCLPFGLLRAVKILVSQRVGAGAEDGIDGYLAAGLLCAVAAGGFVVALSETVVIIVAQMAASEATAQAATGYFEVRCLGAPVFLTAVAVREARYGLGDSRSPMVVTVVANAANIGLDYLFIFGLGGGVEGAAWASVCAQLLEAVALTLLQMRRGGLKLQRFRPTHMRALLSLGLPSGLQFALEVGSFALLAGIIGRMGDIEMAAHQIAIQVIHFSFLPCFALAEAASVLAGQGVGARKDELVIKAGKAALCVATIYTALCSLLLAFGGGAIARAFGGDAELQRVTSALLVVAATFQVFDGAAMVGRGVLRGTGDVRFPAAVGIVCAWIITPPATYWLGVRLGMGAVGGWLGLCGEITLSAVIYWWRLRRGTWKVFASRSRDRLASKRRSEVEYAPTAAVATEA